MDKLGVRNNTYKTETKPRFQPKNPENLTKSIMIAYLK